jgi:hypothetical protein
MVRAAIETKYRSDICLGKLFSQNSKPKTKNIVAWCYGVY